MPQYLALVYPVVPPPATDCDQDFREFVREYTAAGGAGEKNTRECL